MKNNKIDYNAAATFFKVYYGGKVYIIDDNSDNGLYEVRICKGEWELYEIGLYDYPDIFITGSNQFSKLLKCTGLKDNKGNWVYEGDIMQGTGDNLPCIIRYGEYDYIGFYLEEPKTKLTTKKNGYPRLHDIFHLTTIPDKWSVIDNIFSNTTFYDKYTL